MRKIRAIQFFLEYYIMTFILKEVARLLLNNDKPLRIFYGIKKVPLEIPWVRSHSIFSILRNWNEQVV